MKWLKIELLSYGVETLVDKINYPIQINTPTWFPNKYVPPNYDGGVSPGWKWWFASFQINLLGLLNIAPNTFMHWAGAKKKTWWCILVQTNEGGFKFEGNVFCIILLGCQTNRTF